MGTLTLLTLPIGNLEDLTARARRALEEGTYFAVEDTRTFKALLKRLGIAWSGKKISSYFEHSGPASEEKLLQILEEGHTLHLASEAGGPLISDPGHPLVKKALARGHQLQTLPGVSSVLVALELSGLPPYPFHFYGFFPREKEKGEEFLAHMASLPGTHIFFEAPTRAETTLEKLGRHFPEGHLCAARELTKKFESVYRFQGHEWQEKKAEIVFKGEFTLLVHVAKAEGGKKSSSAEMVRLAQEVLEKGPKKKLLCKLLGEILDKSPKELYSSMIHQ